MMARATCERCGNELRLEGAVWVHVDYPRCPSERDELYQVEVLVRVVASDEDAAWRRVHDYMAGTVTGPTALKEQLDPDGQIVDFDLLDEAATVATPY